MSQPKIELVTNRECPNCQEVKKWLKSRNIDFTEIVLEKDISIEAAKEKYPNLHQLPGCVIDDIHIGSKIEMLRWAVNYLRNNGRLGNA